MAMNIGLVNKRDEELKKIEDYYCSIHGRTGNFQCQECWDKLKELLHDKNCAITIDGDLRKA